MVGQPLRTNIAGLSCAAWGPEDGRTLLALHGLTSTSQVWASLARALPEHRVIAPDLPGRGGSALVTAEPGLAGHVAKVLALADESGLDDVTLVGHSMGAFLAPLVARALGDRVTRVVLVDGGISPDPSPLVRKPVVKLLFTVQTAMLGRRWRDAEAFTQAVDGKAVQGRPDLWPVVHAWSDYLLDSAGHARLDRRRLVADAADTLAGTPTLGALYDHKAPVHALAASHGATDRAGPFLSDAALHRARLLVPRLTSERVEANHVTLLMDPRLAEAVTATSS
ncbi:alpha/beta fold hydrolase [Actinoplanes sp. NPDC051494]|uniref:alpha/beta fold hydrolase n=1 Tax=Actinoplanes sp. NPDC051494 TaxID=3363907 RepID=UPI0037B9E172